MVKFFLKVLIIFTLTSKLFSQFSSNDTSGFVGDYLTIEINYSGTFSAENHYTFKSDMKISNPTAFYPIKVLAGQNTYLNDFEMSKMTDSTYQISVNFNFNSNFSSGDEIFKIYGELFAGNDSISYQNFTNVYLNDTSMNDFSSKIQSTSAPGFINYVRFSRITKSYPNPITSSDILHIDYYIDKKSKIKIWVYDLNGKGLLIEEIKVANLGFHSSEYQIDNSLSAGLYWIYLESYSGTDYKPLVIIK